MIPYYFLLFLILVLSFLSRERKLIIIHKNNTINKDDAYKFLTFITAIVLIAFVGLRYETGADYGNYVNLYYARSNLSWGEVFDGGFDSLTNLFAKLSAFLYNNPTTFFMLYATITLALYVKVIFQNANDIVFAMTIFMLAGPFLWTMGAIRQCLAAAIMFAGHKYLYERKLAKWIIVVLLASLCHTTALIMLPIYFICHMKINLKSTIIIILVAVAIRYSYESFFEIMSFVKGSDQTQYDYMNTQVNILRVLVALAPVFLFVFSPQKSSYSTKENFYVFMAFLNAVFMFSTSKSAYLARISIYTDIYNVFAYPVMLEKFEFRTRVVIKYIIFILFLVFFTFQLLTSNLSDYANVLFG